MKLTKILVVLCGLTKCCWRSDFKELYLLLYFELARKEKSDNEQFVFSFALLYLFLYPHV